MTRKKTFFVTIAVLALVVLLMMIVAGRSRSSAVPKPADTVLSADPVSSTESAEPSEAKDEPVSPSEPAEPSPAEPGRQDGERFEDIFRETININTLNYELYRDMQQIIIDTLDKADYVHVLGRNGNRTDIKVQLVDITNPDKETHRMEKSMSRASSVWTDTTSPSFRMWAITDFHQYGTSRCARCGEHVLQA